jgi:hypothetical protein
MAAKLRNAPRGGNAGPGWVLAIPLVLAACGRLAFDPQVELSDAAEAHDAAPPAFGAGCVVGLDLEEATWTNPASPVVNRCTPGSSGSPAPGARRVDDAVRGRVGEISAPTGCIHIAEAPALHATTGLTLSAWIYPLALDGFNPFGVIAKRTDFAIDDAEYTMFVWTDNTVWVDLDSRNDRNHGARRLSNGRWQQVTVVFDGSLPAAARVTIYVDGAPDATIAESSATLAPYPSALAVGCLPARPAAEPQSALAGRIDDVGVWTRAFTPAEVADWYKATAR